MREMRGENTCIILKGKRIRKKQIRKNITQYSNYIRAIDLPGLIPLWPNEIEDFSEQGTQKIIKHLNRALRKERKRGQEGHWSYDLNKHKALIGALKNETQRLLNKRTRRE